MGELYVNGYLIREGYRYTKDHEWIYVEGKYGKVGITDYAQKMLGDIVFVQLPKVGERIDGGEVLAELESVKNVAPVYNPVSGEVVEVNEDLKEEPSLINEEPYEGGWIAVIELEKLEEYEALMDANEYANFLKELVEEEGETGMTQI